MPLCQIQADSCGHQLQCRGGGVVLYAEGGEETPDWRSARSASMVLLPFEAVEIQNGDSRTSGDLRKSCTGNESRRQPSRLLIGTDHVGSLLHAVQHERSGL